MADVTLPPLTNDLRCAPQAVELGLDPRGTATMCSTLVLIEYSGAWPAKIEQLDLVASLPPLGPGHRILLTRGSGPGDQPTLSVWEAGDDLTWAGTDYEVLPDRLPEAMAALADGGSPAEADGVMSLGSAPPEVLVCGHGSRDTCCGNFGIRLLAQVTERAEQAWPGVRVRRCSHTGGHRFAPTGITLPEGRMWAFLDLDLLDAAVVGRSDANLGPANRGLMALDPLAQVAEAAMLDRLGPAWRFQQPTIEWLDPTGPDRQRFRFTWSTDGVEQRAEVSVRRAGTTPVPACGQSLEEATKTSPILQVDSLVLQG